MRKKRAVRRTLAAALAIMLGGVAARLTYQVSVQPGAALVRAVFEAGPEVKPPAGFAKIEATVVETRGAAVAPAASINLYAPRTTRPAAGWPVILWIHGGGFISSSADTVRDYAILLARRGYLVASLDYSLAPGERYPVPVQQGNAALAYLEAHVSVYGGDPTRVVLGGDSAGAQIAGQLAAVQTNPALARAMNLRPGVASDRLRGTVLLCGLYDLRTVAGTGFPALRTYLWAYTGTRNWTKYRDIDQLSVTEQATSAYPPTFLTVGDADPFRTQASELAATLTARGVAVDTLFWTGLGLGHEYQFDFRRPQANQAFGATVAFLAVRTKA